MEKKIEYRNCEKCEVLVNEKWTQAEVLYRLPSVGGSNEYRVKIVGGGIQRVDANKMRKL